MKRSDPSIADITYQQSTSLGGAYIAISHQQDPWGTQLRLLAYLNPEL